MKRKIFSILVVMLGLVTLVNAQTGKKTSKQQKTQKATPVAKANTATTDTTISLVSASANQAYGTSSSQRLSISDPTINMLKQQAAGNETIISSSGIVGMPKRTYGFANGKILLRPTTAPSSGTMYGSGSVGTGTTIHGIGTAENTIGVNGKNPYAGPWMWGSKLPNRNLPLTDSTGRGQ